MERWIAAGFLVVGLVAVNYDTDKKLNKVKRHANLLNMENDMLIELLKGVTNPDAEKRVHLQKALDDLKIIRIERLEF